jgi:hypothetical protein
MPFEHFIRVPFFRSPGQDHSYDFFTAEHAENTEMNRNKNQNAEWERRKVHSQFPHPDFEF